MAEAYGIPVKLTDICLPWTQLLMRILTVYVMCYSIYLLYYEQGFSDKLNGLMHFLYDIIQSDTIFKLLCISACRHIKIFMHGSNHLRTNIHNYITNRCMSHKCWKTPAGIRKRKHKV